MKSCDRPSTQPIGNGALSPRGGRSEHHDARAFRTSGRVSHATLARATRGLRRLLRRARPVAHLLWRWGTRRQRRVARPRRAGARTTTWHTGVPGSPWACVCRAGATSADDHPCVATAHTYAAIRRMTHMLTAGRGRPVHQRRTIPPARREHGTRLRGVSRKTHLLAPMRPLPYGRGSDRPRAGAWRWMADR